MRAFYYTLIRNKISVPALVSYEQVSQLQLKSLIGKPNPHFFVELIKKNFFKP